MRGGGGPSLLCRSLIITYSTGPRCTCCGNRDSGCGGRGIRNDGSWRFRNDGSWRFRFRDNDGKVGPINVGNAWWWGYVRDRWALLWGRAGKARDGIAWVVASITWVGWEDGSHLGKSRGGGRLTYRWSVSQAQSLLLAGIDW